MKTVYFSLVRKNQRDVLPNLAKKEAREPRFWIDPFPIEDGPKPTIQFVFAQNCCRAIADGSSTSAQRIKKHFLQTTANMLSKKTFCWLLDATHQTFNSKCLVVVVVAVVVVVVVVAKE